ncbi:MAG: helix-turn-helix domain-containing protein [Syntrophobacteraceae bacterium]
MTPFEIKVALMRKGVSMRSVAERLGVSPNAVSLVVHRRMVSGRIMSELAKAIEVDVSVAFPERFSRERTSSPITLHVP